MTGAADDTPENDQSMDDILASIRRIMLDEQARLQDGSGHLAYAADRSPATNASVDPVLILDSSMVVEGEPDDAFTIPRVGEAATILPSGRIDMPPAPAEVEQTPDAKRVFVTAPAPAGPAPVSLDHSPQPVVMSAQAIEALMAPAAAAAAAASVDALIKQLSEERLAVLRSSSPAASPAAIPQGLA
jgi:hypothetical protein